MNQNTKNPLPEDWPNTLCVWDDGTDWDGMAVDPNNRPEDFLQRWLDDTGDHQTTGPELWAQKKWARVEWDDQKGAYTQERFERPNGTPIQYERSYCPEELSYLPDMYTLEEYYPDD
jgi:hypothetical protein